MSVLVAIVLGCVVAGLGYYAGRVDEWLAVTRYLGRYENEKPVWWLLTGIFADEHRRKHRRRAGREFTEPASKPGAQ